MTLASMPTLAGWLLSIALHGGLLLAAAWLIDRTLRLAPATRESMWRCALLGGVLSASLQALMPALPQVGQLVLPASTNTSATAPTSLRSSATDVQVLAAIPSESLAKASAANDASIRPMPNAIGIAQGPKPQSGSTLATRLPSPPLVVLALWLSGTLLAFARLGMRFANLRRVLARAKPVIAPADLAALARRAGVRMPALYTLPDIASPFAFGRCIVVPEWATSLDPRQLQAMLAHELAHVARRDPQWRLVIECWRAGFWFLPFAGIAQRRLDELAELACDAFAARQTGDAHAVAECLAACAERHFDNRAYALMPAMAARGSTLIQRIDRLLEGTAMSTTQPGLLLRAATVAVLTACAFGLPSIGFLSPVAQAQTPPAPPAPPSAPKSSQANSSISISSHDGNRSMRVIIDDDSHGLSLDAKGKIEFSDDETDIASLGAGGTATLEEKRDGTTRRLELADHNGTLERHYFVDRREQPFDAAAHAWLAALLPNLIRESGLGAEARVQRIYAKGGATAVLAEIDQIHSDYVRSVYLGLLIDKGQLSAADLDHCLRLAGAMGGDYEKQQTLSKIFAKQTLDAKQQSAFLQQALNIHGAYELSELLIAILPRLDNSAEVRANWFAAAAHVDGDYERARTLQAVLDSRDLSDSELAGLLQASSSVHGDYEHSQVLIAIAKRARNVEAIAPAYAQSASKIGGDYERAQSLLALIQTGKLGSAGANAVLDAAAKGGADYERSQVLIALAQTMPDDAALVAHYRQVASHLAGYEREQAEKALRR